MTIEELLSAQELINYIKERPTIPMLGPTLFPERKIEGLKAELIKGAGGLPISASIHGFDTEAEIGGRDGVNYDLAELAFIKRKKRLTEEQIIQLESPRNSMEEQQIIDKIFNDVEELAENIETRVEALRMEALSTGKLAINENGVKLAIDYGAPTDHKKSFTWGSGTPDILQDIYDACDKIVDDTGFTPTRALTSKRNLNIILRDEKIRKGTLGVNSDKLLSQAELNAFLSSQGLPTIAIYDKKFRKDNKKGGYTVNRFFPEAGFILMPDGMMGETLYGLTAEELELRKNPAVDMETIGNITVVQYATIDPVAKWTKAVATALPSFPYADQVFMATIA
ncbi:major capsid protein [Bacilliculturomica massiliensis]|uniref:major capsid protein n=1 Tax=Bacilliculturomica massiliensis TaxID=1917867 RepID=UPI001FE7249A|nr:major capsid protein [Bacilliculturomica massiliensis]